MIVACLGSGLGRANEPYYDAMVAVGLLLAQRHITVATGGYGGAGMEAPALGARSVGGDVVGYLFTGLNKRSNDYLTEHFHVHGTTEVQFGDRLGQLLMADAFIVCAKAGIGTLVELLAVVNMTAKLWSKPRPMALLYLPNSPKELDDAPIITPEFLGDLYRAGYLPPDAMATWLAVATTPIQAVNWVSGVEHPSTFQ